MGGLAHAAVRRSSAKCRSFRRLATLEARFVLPDPGIPATAMRRRFDAGVAWDLAVSQRQFRIQWWSSGAERRSSVLQVLSTKRFT